MPRNTANNEGDIVIAHTDAIADKLDQDIIDKAVAGNTSEESMTIRQALAKYGKAVAWSMALSAALIMEGYDTTAMGSFYGQPIFLRRFGVPAPGTTNGFVIPAPWQSGLSNGASAGGILGLLINGWAADRFGSRRVMMASLVAMAAFIFIFVFANSLTMLVIGQVLCGIPWGVFQTLTTAYAADVCPTQLRGYLTAYVNMCWGIGILLSSGVVKACLDTIKTDWSWRLPFTLQWIWIPPLFAVVYFCPESPWWLVRKGRLEDAAQSLRSLTNASHIDEQDIQNRVANMQHTNALEIEASVGTSYVDCFRRTDRRRTEIVMVVFAMQVTSGQGLVGQGVQFLQTAGVAVGLSFSLNMVLNSMFIIGTAISWGLLTLFGRRTLYTSGMAIMCCVQFIIGGLAFNRTNEKTIAIGALLIMLNLIYNCTLGPMCYTIIGETGSTRLRQKSIVLARCAYKATNIVNGIILPRMLSPTAWNLGPKTGLFYGVTAFLSTIYCLLRVPETKGRSYGELDILFENRIPAWRFKSTKVDQFGQSEYAIEKSKQKEAEFEHQE